MVIINTVIDNRNDNIVDIWKSKGIPCVHIIDIDPRIRDVFQIPLIAEIGIVRSGVGHRLNDKLGCCILKRARFIHKIRHFERIPFRLLCTRKIIDTRVEFVFSQYLQIILFRDFLKFGKVLLSCQLYAEYIRYAEIDAIACFKIGSLIHYILRVNRFLLGVIQRKRRKTFLHAELF